MFSHTIKGQAYNMPLLSRFLEGSSSSSGQAIETLPRLVDYELLCGPGGKRTVGFGWFAGGRTWLPDARHSKLMLNQLPVLLSPYRPWPTLIWNWVSRVLFWCVGTFLSRFDTGLMHV
jgi:hypothetical protein